MTTVAIVESRTPLARSLATRAGRWLLLCALLLLSVPTLLAQLTFKADNGAITITGYAGTISQLTIPETIDGLPVRSIGNDAFNSRSDLTSVTIPNSVTSIGDQTFYGCTGLTDISVEGANPSLSSVNGVLFNKTQTELIRYPQNRVGAYTLPNSVTSICNQAFNGCKGLTSVSIGNSVTSIGEGAFYNCTGLTSVSIPNSVTSIGTGAFSDNNGLTDLQVDGANPSFSSVNGVLFNKTQTELVQYPAKRAGAYTLPNSVTSIGDFAFSGCTGLTSVSIPNSVTSIGVGAFLNCTGLTSVSIGKSVTSIGNYAFYGCTGLASLSIPNSVTAIGYYAFDRCTGLTGVYFEGDQPASDSSAFGAPTTLYHLPGKTGWGATFSGRPTVLWNPSAPAQDPAFGVRDGKFGFKITGTAGIPVVVEACDSLTEPVWVPVGTNTFAGGSSLFSDPSWASHPSRVYRFRSP